MGCPFKAVSDERRRKILLILSKDDANSGEIASKFKISQPTVSNHLRILKEAGLIKERKFKQNRIYSLNKTNLQKMINTLQDLSE